MSDHVDSVLERARSVRDEVLSHPDHAAGLDHTSLRIVAVDHHRGYTRLVGAIDGLSSLEQDAAAWAAPNQAVRLVLPQPDLPGPQGRENSRIYTVRRFWVDGGAGLIEIDVVRHGCPSPAMRWLDDVAVGQRLPLTGPRPHHVPNVDECDRALWFADASALPAVYSLLSRWSAPVPLHVTVAVDDLAPVHELPPMHDVFIERVSPVPGALLDAASRLDLDARTDVWAAGERDEMRALRAQARECGVPTEHVHLFGYWRSGVSGTALDASRVLYYKERLDRGLGMSGVDDLDIPD